MIVYNDTWKIKERMDAAGWSGPKWVDGNAWATDWRESCSSSYGANGADNYNADHFSFAIYSGHGNPGTLYFGVQHDTCSININNQTRLGAMGGATAAVAMYNSCKTLHDAGYNEWVWQQLGFYNNVGANAQNFGNFFEDTYWKSNSQAWLDRVSGPAIVISYSNGTDNCWTVSNGAMLKANTYTEPRGGGPSCQAGLPQHQECIRYK